MSLSDRRWFLVVALALPLAVAACGFTPVYGPGGNAQGLRGSIALADPKDQLDYELVKALEQRLTRATNPEYDLAYTITTDKIAVGITPDQETRRYHMTGRVDFTVTARTTSVIVSSGRVESFTAYGATGSTVSTLAAEADAKTRLMGILADQITARLLATAGGWQ